MIPVTQYERGFFFKMFLTSYILCCTVQYEYTCRLMNRRLALHAWARSSLPTAPTQLLIIMTTHTPLGLVRPACAPTAIDRCRALPPTTPLALLVTVFPAGTSDCFASCRSFLVVAQVRLLGTTSRLQNWAGARGAKLAHGDSSTPSLHQHRSSNDPC